ncbi:MAG: HD domain-containing protein [Planctomycetes bacterium]|nr:HD domain-containing protein [Planctomycetota bacterium]
MKNKSDAGQGAPKKRKTPIPVAVIDVGATSVRMTIAEIKPNGDHVIIEELVHPVSLGVDTFQCGHIRPVTMRAVCQVLSNFSRVLKQYEVEEVRAVATSAIREASNQDVVIDRIRHESGIDLLVLDAVEESRLTYKTILPFLKKRLRSKKRHTMLIDLGGGSTEIMVLKGHDLAFAGSRRLGMSRIFHSSAQAECQDSQAMLETAIRNIVGSTEDLYRAYPIKECVIINGLLVNSLSDEKKVEAFEDGICLSSESFRKASVESAGMNSQERSERFDIGPADSELLLPAMMITQAFLDTLSVKRIFFVDADMMQGMLGDLISEINGKDPLEEFNRQIICSAQGLADKYHYDKKHAEQVHKLCCQLFDSFSAFLDLDAKDRIFLRVAAIIHDIGMFVSELAHHKHSYYLIRWSEIVGLSDDDREIIAQVVRYHRKASPSPTHSEYMALSVRDRIKVSKLASILRIADALDRRHRQDIHSLHAKITDDELIIKAETTGDLMVEQAAMLDKGNLFSEITGIKVVLKKYIP